MTLPPLYKYLDVNGARLTLSNGTFKHAKPSDFNDVEDLTVRSIFPEANEIALNEIKNNFTRIISENLDKTPTCINAVMRQQVALIQEVFRANPDAAELVAETMKKDELSKLYDLDRLKIRNKGFIEEINRFMQGFRVLCVSEDGNSERMWNRYAQESQGIVLRIVPNVSKDSKYILFHKVKYAATRPSLFMSALDFIESGMFADQQKRMIQMIDDVVYSKTLEWEYENEYRLVAPIIGAESWNTMPYHPEEIPELYFGKNTSIATKAELTALAKWRNPNVKIFHSCVQPDGRVLFI